MGEGAGDLTVTGSRILLWNGTSLAVVAGMLAVSLALTAWRLRSIEP